MNIYSVTFTGNIGAGILPNLVLANSFVAANSVAQIFAEERGLVVTGITLDTDALEARVINREALSSSLNRSL